MDDESQKVPAKAKPWNIGSIIPWSIASTVGDPILILAPLAFTALIATVVLAAGAASSGACQTTPACPAQILVPIWSLPPFDSYQDAGAISLATSSPAVIWIFRGVALVLRAAFLGFLAHLALQRARESTPNAGTAATIVRSRLRSLSILELASFGAFGIPLVLAQGSLLDAGRPISQLGALLGELLLLNAFLAVFGEGAPGKAFFAGLRWLRRRPLGHIALCVLATAASNGVYWLAQAGEAGRPRDVALALFSLLHAVVTTVFLVAFARRWTLLYQRT